MKYLTANSCYLLQGTDISAQRQKLEVRKVCRRITTIGCAHQLQQLSGVTVCQMREQFAAKDTEYRGVGSDAERQ